MPTKLHEISTNCNECCFSIKIKYKDGMCKSAGCVLTDSENGKTRIGQLKDYVVTTQCSDGGPGIAINRAFCAFWRNKEWLNICENNHGIDIKKRVEQEAKPNICAALLLDIDTFDITKYLEFLFAVRDCFNEVSHVYIIIQGKPDGVDQGKTHANIHELAEKHIPKKEGGSFNILSLQSDYWNYTPHLLDHLYTRSLKSKYIFLMNQNHVGLVYNIGQIRNNILHNNLPVVIAASNKENVYESPCMFHIRAYGSNIEVTDDGLIINRLPDYLESEDLTHLIFPLEQLLDHNTK